LSSGATCCRRNGTSRIQSITQLNSRIVMHDVLMHIDWMCASRKNMDKKVLCMLDDVGVFIHIAIKQDHISSVCRRLPHRKLHVALFVPDLYSNEVLRELVTIRNVFQVQAG